MTVEAPRRIPKGYLQHAVTWPLNGAIAVYAIACLYFMVFGEIAIRILGFNIIAKDLIYPIAILALFIFLRLIASPRLRKPVVFSALTALISMIFISFIFLLGEGYVRYFHKDNMASTSATGRDKRGGGWKSLINAKAGQGGKRLIMVQGDSITWGVGVSDWELLYPNQLLKKLNEGPMKHDMLILAEPGMEIDWHAGNLAEIGDTLRPDILIYQWYINDIEVRKPWPPPPLPTDSWRNIPLIDTIGHNSWLYVLLENRLNPLLSKAYGTDYQSYLTDRYREDTEDWQIFLFYFHSWANQAQAYSKRVIMFMYPCVPYSGEYPFADFSSRLKKLCRPHIYALPAIYMGHIVGAIVNDSSLEFGKALMAQPNDANGPLMYGPYLPFGAGESSATFWLKSASAKDGEVAEIDIVSDFGKTVHARQTINKSDFVGENKWLPFTLKFKLDKFTQGLEFRVMYKGNGYLYADKVEIPMNYNIEALDMLPYLSGFDTHATLMDAHPNAKAHAVIATELYNQITR